MAVAIPVLEKNKITEDNRAYAYNVRSVEEEEHNARIKRNYAMLINPETKLGDLIERSEPVVEKQTELFNENRFANVPATRAENEYKPYLVENARATSSIFRADNPVNRRAVETGLVVEPLTKNISEEENEDLRPTRTTIQYRTNNAANSVEEGQITNKRAGKRINLSKRDKIIAAVVISIVVAIFALIIINSVLISGLNNDISSLQSSLTDVKGTYAGISDEIKDFAESIADTVEEFALGHGMIR